MTSSGDAFPRNLLEPYSGPFNHADGQCFQDFDLTTSIVCETYLTCFVFRKLKIPAHHVFDNRAPFTKYRSLLFLKNIFLLNGKTRRNF